MGPSLQAPAQGLEPSFSAEEGAHTEHSSQDPGLPSQSAMVKLIKLAKGTLFVSQSGGWQGERDTWDVCLAWLRRTMDVESARQDSARGQWA